MCVQKRDLLDFKSEILFNIKLVLLFYLRKMLIFGFDSSKTEKSFEKKTD